MVFKLLYIFFDFLREFFLYFVLDDGFLMNFFVNLIFDDSFMYFPLDKIVFFFFFIGYELVDWFF